MLCIFLAGCGKNSPRITLPHLLVVRIRDPHERNWTRDVGDDLLDGDVRADGNDERLVVYLEEPMRVLQDRDPRVLEYLCRGGTQDRILRVAADVAPAVVREEIAQAEEEGILRERRVGAGTVAGNVALTHLVRVEERPKGKPHDLSHLLKYPVGLDVIAQPTVVRRRLPGLLGVA